MKNNVTPSEKSRFEHEYISIIKDKLRAELGLKNIMQVPKLVKIVLNVGVKEAVGDSKMLSGVVNVLTKIAAQAAIKTFARKSIASFKLREGMAIGAKVTLRGHRMYEFFDRFINLALPKVRDFQGLPTTLDGRGGYNIGIKDWSIFPEVAFGVDEKLHGLNVSVHMSTKKDSEGIALLKAFGLPFRKV